jgi:hypothetical protein
MRHHMRCNSMYQKQLHDAKHKNDAKGFGRYLNATMPSNRLQAPVGCLAAQGQYMCLTFCEMQASSECNLIECHAGQDWDGVYTLTLKTTLCRQAKLVCRVALTCLSDFLT